jgi:quinol-cytochrome oxidoreductase complex cytochrome b subunit
VSGVLGIGMRCSLVEGFEKKQSVNKINTGLVHNVEVFVLFIFMCLLLLLVLDWNKNKPAQSTNQPAMATSQSIQQKKRVSNSSLGLEIHTLLWGIVAGYLEPARKIDTNISVVTVIRFFFF